MIPSIPASDDTARFSFAGRRLRQKPLLNEAHRRHTFPVDTGPLGTGFLVEYEPIRSDFCFDELLHRVHLR